MDKQKLINGIDLSVFGSSVTHVRDGWLVGAKYRAFAVFSPDMDKLKITICGNKATSPLKIDDTETFVFNVIPLSDHSSKGVYNNEAYNYRPEKEYGGCAFNSYDGYEVYPTIKQLIVDLIKVAEKNR